MANEAEQALYQKLAAVPTFHPSTASLLPDDWALEPGDVVTVQSDGQDYLTPVYSMELEWNGAPRVSIQSTGNKKRAPLSALQRKSFSSGRSGYKTQKDLDEAKVQYDRHFTATDRVVESTMTAVGVKLNPDGTPMVDPETGEYVFDDQGATLSSKVIATAGELATEVSTRTQQGETFSTAISQTSTSISQIVTAVGSNGEVTAASIVTAINTDDTIGPTTSIRLSADKINLTGYVTATSLDTRLLNADALFTQQGYAGTIYANGLSGATGNISDLTVGTLRMTTSGTSSDTVSRKGVKIAGTLQQNLTVLGTGTDVSLDVPNAIATIVVDDNPPSGKIGFKYTTLASSTPVAVNFSIADTAYYQSHVGIASVGSWAWDSEEEDYVTVVTPNAGSTQMVYPPTITTPVTSGNATWNDSTWTKSVNVGIKGPATSGVTHDLANGVSISVSENWRERVAAADGKSLSMTIKFANGATSLGNVTLTGIGNTIYTNGHTDGVADGRSEAWSAARSKLSFPSATSTTKSSFSFSFPGTTYNTAATYDYSLSVADGYAVVTDDSDVVVAKVTAASAPLATQIDMQVRSASQSVPSAPSGAGSTMVFASTFSDEIMRYASQSGGPWYIPFDMTISGGTGTKRYYVKIN